VQGFRTGTRELFDIVGLRGLWFAISGAIMVVGIGFLVTRGLNLGLDYTGGGQVRFYTGEGVQLPEVGDPARANLSQTIQAKATELAGRETQVRLIDRDQVSVQFQTTTDENLEATTGAIRDGLSESFATELGALRGGDPNKPDKYDTNFIGPKVGEQLRANGLKALIAGCAFILLYMWWRFDWRFGVATIMALFHDGLILLGIFAIGHWEVDLAFIAAVLTVLGYSVTDSVVIFDRLRENLGARRRVTDYAGVVNDSLIQTLPRSLNTTATTLFTLIFLFFFGGDSIHTFALALFVGIFFGAYSSVFIAAPIVVQWEAMRPRHGEAGRTAARRAAPPAQRAALSTAAEDRAAGAGMSDGSIDAFDGVDDATKARAQAAKGQKIGAPRKSKRRH
jgi:preprotein translocase subunit SecF